MADGRAALNLGGHEIPASWLVGDFQLAIAEVTAGGFDERSGVFQGVTGTAWLHLPCAVPPPSIVGVLDDPDVSRLTQAVEVVADVLHPQTEIAVADAQHLQPGALVGDTISVNLTVDRSDLREIVELGQGMPGWLGSEPASAGFPVQFSDLTVSLDGVPAGVGRVIDGVVTYPIGGHVRYPIEIVIDGFTVIITTLELTPHRSTGTAQVQLPGGITDVGSCEPAIIDLGIITMSPSCDFYLDAPDQAYGPWLLGDTGLVIEGTGYVLDLSAVTSPAPWPASWRGLTLGAGTGSGEQFVPEPCNTGYLRGQYTYPDAIVVSSGFYASLALAKPVSFTAINPLGTTLTFRAGSMIIWSSRIAGRRTERRVDRAADRRGVRGPAGPAGDHSARRHRNPARPRPCRRARLWQPTDQLGRAHPPRPGGGGVEGDLRNRLPLPACRGLRVVLPDEHRGVLGRGHRIRRGCEPSRAGGPASRRRVVPGAGRNPGPLT